MDRWLPGGPPRWSGVTLHHLLSHTAGVPHWLEALASFTTALHAGNLITNESLHAMLTPHAPIDDDDETLITTGYGYGMFTGTFAGHPAYYHPGDNPGYRSFAGWLPDQAASLVVLSNDGVNMTNLLRQLLPATLSAQAGDA